MHMATSCLLQVITFRLDNVKILLKGANALLNRCWAVLQGQIYNANMETKTASELHGPVYPLYLAHWENASEAW